LLQILLVQKLFRLTHSKRSSYRRRAGKVAECNEERNYDSPSCRSQRDCPKNAINCWEWQRINWLL